VLCHQIHVQFFLFLTCILVVLIILSCLLNTPNLFLFLIALVAVCSYYQSSRHVLVSELPFTESVTLHGTVSQFEEPRATSKRLILKVKELCVFECYSVSFSVFVYVRPYSELSYGDSVSLRGSLERATSFLADDGQRIDYQRLVSARGITYTMIYPTIVDVTKSKQQ
jgi:hypothetical protein